MATVQDIIEKYSAALGDWKQKRRELESSQGLGVAPIAEKFSTLGTEDERIKAMRDYLGEAGVKDVNYSMTPNASGYNMAGFDFNPVDIVESNPKKFLGAGGQGRNYYTGYEATAKDENAPDITNRYLNDWYFKDLYNKYYQTLKPQKTAGIMSGTAGQARPSGQRKAYAEYLRGSVY